MIQTVTPGQAARDAGLEIMYIFDRDRPKAGGVTVVWSPAHEYDRSRSTTALISVAYCRPGDAFDKRIGLELAMQRMYNDNYIILPIYQHGEDYVHETIRTMFSQFVH